MKNKKGTLNKRSDNNSIRHRYPVTSSSLSPWPITIHRFEAVDQNRSTQLTFHSEEELYEQLEKWSKRTIQSKETNFLISPATFNTTSGKSKKDVSYASILIIDVDGGDLSPDDFSAIFPAIKMCIFNTYSDEDNRYRVLIPLSCKVTPAAYRDLVESIIAAIQNSFLGYAGKNQKIEDARKALRHGIDNKSKNIEMIYYAPSQSKDSSRSFFVVYDGKALNVLKLLRRPIHDQRINLDGLTHIESNKPLKEMTVDEATEMQINAIKQHYKMLQPGCGGRNDAFHEIAERMWWLGIRDVSRIEAELIDADHDRARERKGHIKSTMRFVRKLEAQWKMRA